MLKTSDLRTVKSCKDHLDKQQKPDLGVDQDKQCRVYAEKEPLNYPSTAVQ